MARPLSLSSALSPTMALALPLLLTLLRATPVATGLGAPGGSCGVPPSAWCQDWVTALRCGALGRCPHLTQGHPDMDVCDTCQQFFGSLHRAFNHSAMEVPVGTGDRCHCTTHGHQRCNGDRSGWGVVAASTAVVAVTVAVTVGARAQVVLDQKPWQVCATLKLCRGESGAAPAAPILEAPGTHLQGSGGAGLSPEALPLPLPLCWLCRSLVARAEAAVPVGAVAAAVAGLCRALPLPVAGACQCLAERYAALAIEGLLGRLGPRLLCRLFFACRSGDNGDIEDVGTLPPPWVREAIVVRLAECVSEEAPKGVSVPALSLPLGPCALGPTFWCSGFEAARRCQALQHCQEHVWL
ncbi:pulmonary surfactant-associated protein B [Catharus ustulatus]|uniref:pulmonary surfactant-associated protein B n=1 Tax=Catharus ustulatus TaxID=91951 RepID=UPI00140CBDF6|nr:pulmonary surfactant-associated protein B [Catharus ustulatus]